MLDILSYPVRRPLVNIICILFLEQFYATTGIALPMRDLCDGYTFANGPEGDLEVSDELRLAASTSFSDIQWN
jgi:hypothetical protein